MRTKDVFDGATPSANAVAALALARLGALTGASRYTDGGPPESVDLFGELLSRHPTAFAHTVLTAVAAGRRGSPRWSSPVDRPDLVDAVRDGWWPGVVLAWGEPTASPLWEGRTGDRAYVCRNYTCRLPAGRRRPPCWPQLREARGAGETG